MTAESSDFAGDEDSGPMDDPLSVITPNSAGHSAKNEENQKDITYKIVIPADPAATAKDVLNGKIKRKNGGFCGRKILFFLVAIWGEESAFLGNTEWSPELFTCELTDPAYEERSNHISTNELKQTAIAGESLVRGNMAAVPLMVQLPRRPATSATLSVWKDDFSNLVAQAQIDVTLPVNYVATFNIEHDTLKIALDFAGSLVDVNDFDLHFLPRSYISLAQYEEAFALQRIGQGSEYVLSFASNNAIRLLQGMLLGLTVIWGKSEMMSNFEIEIPLPQSGIALLWDVPKLTRLKQTTLSCEVTNISDSVLNAKVKLGDSPMIPLVKSVEINDLNPNEKRVISVPCVPTLVGNRELIYKVKVQSQWFKPLFKTIVHID